MSSASQLPQPLRAQVASKASNSAWVRCKQKVAAQDHEQACRFVLHISSKADQCCIGRETNRDCATRHHGN